jgi:hypothetical protein
MISNKRPVWLEPPLHVKFILLTRSPLQSSLWH